MIRTCSDVAGLFPLTLEAVMFIAKASGRLDSSIEATVLGDLEAPFKEEKAFQGIDDFVLPHHG